MMVGCELQPAAEAHCKGAEFTAMVGLAGELCGVLSVRCSQSSASQVAALMLDLAPETAAEHDDTVSIAASRRGDLEDSHGRICRRHVWRARLGFGG